MVTVSPARLSSDSWPTGRAQRARRLLALPAALAMAFTATSALAGVPEDMKTLIEQRRAAEAYELGLKHEEMLGQPLFDYYFGIAAVDAGRATLGALALERFMLQDPSNDLARLELGRAYYLIGDYARALREFEAVLAKSPPVSVQITVRRFLAAMRDSDGPRLDLGGFVEAGFGWTSNANSGVGSANLTLPFFGDVRLDNSALATPSELQQVAAGLVLDAPVAGKIKAILSTSAAAIRYGRARGYDIAIGSASLAVGHVTDTFAATVGPTGTFALLDGKKYRWSYGLKGNLRYQLTAGLAANAEVSQQTLRYAGLNANRAGKLFSASLGAQQRLPLPLTPTITAEGYYAKDKNTRQRADFTRRIKGGRAGIILLPSKQTALTMGYGLARWHYAGADPLFGTKRNDWFRTIDASARVFLQQGLSLRLEGQIAHDDASLPLYRFKQRQIALVLRREWE
jgi:hypothetical protein